MSIALLAATLTSCTREMEKKGSVLRISPSNLGPIAQSFPTTGTLCWGANVTAPDIVGQDPTTPTCGPRLGAFTGFTSGSTTLSLDVPKGTGRTVTLYLYHSTTSTCPNWTANLANRGAIYDRVYKVGEVTGVNMSTDNTSVTIAAAYPGDANNIVTVANQGVACGVLGNAVTVVTSGGLVLNPDFTALATDDPSHPTLANSFKWTTGRGIFSEANEVNASGLGISVRSQVFSLTRKPDTGALYGLLHDGSVVAVNSSTGDYTDISGSCPFTTCTVPVWMQSITAGTGTNLFALDHAGKFYKVLTASTLEATSQTFPAFVRQVTLD